MKLPEYVTVDEVRRVCKELRIRDWGRTAERNQSSAQRSKSRLKRS